MTFIEQNNIEKQPPPTESQFADINSKTAIREESVVLFAGQREDRNKTAAQLMESSSADNADLLIVDDLEDTINILQKDEDDEEEEELKLG